MKVRSGSRRRKSSALPSPVVKQPDATGESREGRRAVFDEPEDLLV